MNDNNEIKLDYNIQDASSRKDLVQKIISQNSSKKLTNQYLDILSDYVIFAMNKEEKKEKTILTENRMITINKRETSYEGLTEKFANGEDGVSNIIKNDKNQILSPKVSITDADVAEIPALKQLVDAIKIVEEQEKKACGKKKFLLKKQLIEMRQDQYSIKNDYKQPLYSSSTVKSFVKADLEEKITFDENNEPVSNGLVSLFNPKHISALLCNYSALKEDSYGNFVTDAYFLMQDLDNLIEKTLRDKYPIYYRLLILKIDGKTNLEIQEILLQEFNIRHTVEYISSLWRNKIPKLLAEQEKEDYIIWYYTTQEYGKWKRCSRCKQIKLAHNRFFSKNNTSKDSYYSICKECRNKKTPKEEEDI